VSAVEIFAASRAGSNWPPTVRVVRISWPRKNTPVTFFLKNSFSELSSMCAVDLVSSCTSHWPQCILPSFRSSYFPDIFWSTFRSSWKLRCWSIISGILSASMRWRYDRTSSGRRGRELKSSTMRDFGKRRGTALAHDGKSRQPEEELRRRAIVLRSRPPPSLHHVCVRRRHAEKFL